MFANVRFFSRNGSDAALPLPVYRALIESLFKGAASNSINVVAYVLLAGFQFWRSADWRIAAVSSAVAATGLARIFVERRQQRRFQERGGVGLATIADVRRSELRYLTVMAAFALALGTLQFFVLATDGNGDDRLLMVAAGVIFAVSSPARCSASPGAVAVQAWLIVLPFCAAVMMKGGASGYFGVVLALFLVRHLRDATKSLHGAQVSMLMAQRAAEDVADKFDTALNNMARGLVMIDSNCRVQIANYLFADIFSLAAPPVDLPVGQLIARFITPLIAEGEGDHAIYDFFAGRGGASREWRPSDGRILDLFRQPMPQGSVITVADVSAG